MRAGKNIDLFRNEWQIVWLWLWLSDGLFHSGSTRIYSFDRLPKCDFGMVEQGGGGHARRYDKVNFKIIHRIRNRSKGEAFRCHRKPFPTEYIQIVLICLICIFFPGRVICINKHERRPGGGGGRTSTSKICIIHIAFNLSEMRFCQSPVPFGQDAGNCRLCDQHHRAHAIVSSVRPRTDHCRFGECVPINPKWIKIVCQPSGTSSSVRVYLVLDIGRRHLFAINLHRRGRDWWFTGLLHSDKFTNEILVFRLILTSVIDGIMLLHSPSGMGDRNIRAIANDDKNGFVAMDRGIAELQQHNFPFSPFEHILWWLVRDRNVRMFKWNASIQKMTSFLRAHNLIKRNFAAKIKINSQHGALARKGLISGRHLQWQMAVPICASIFFFFFSFINLTLESHSQAGKEGRFATNGAR